MQPIYILKGHFIGYHILFTKHKKVFLLWRNWPFSKTLIFADFCWRQQKLEGLWQQTAYQKTPFDRFYQLTKFHDQSFSQTGSIEDWKNADIIKMLLFWSIFGRSRTTHPSQKACNLYIYSERTFYWLSYPFYKTQKNVFVLEK